MKKCFAILFGFTLLTGIVVAQPPAGDGPPKPPSVKERLSMVSEKMDKELQLSAAQKQVIQNAFKDFFDKAEKLRGKTEQPPPPPQPDKAAMDKLSRDRDAKIQAVLKPAQFQKYVAIEKTMRPPGPGGPQGKKQ